MVREAVKEDLFEILNLYLFLHEDNVPEDSEHLQKTWKDILEDVNHHIIVNEIDGKIISSCVMEQLAKAGGFSLFRVIHICNNL